MLEILDSIIATAAVVLGLSLIVQAIQQIIKQLFDLKSSYMRAALLAMFNSSGTAKSFATNFIPATMLGNKADQFAKDVVKQIEECMTTFGFTNLHLVETFDEKKLKDVVLSLPIAEDTTLKQKVDQAMEDIDRWFDVSKKAFQENYERRMRPWAFGISAVLVIALNANLFDIYREFSHNKTLRDAGVAMAQRLTSASSDSAGNLAANEALIQTSSDSAIASRIKGNIQNIQEILDDESFQLMGWNDARLQRVKDKSPVESFFHYFVGWLTTILLVSLGAPFWFDFLKTVSGIKDRMKGVGKKEKNEGQEE